MYNNGEGVNVDYKESAQWYCKAAEQGVSRAQFYLGTMYEIGRGVAKDVNTAIRCYGAAARQGDEDAKKALERLR